MLSLNISESEIPVMSIRVRITPPPPQQGCIHIVVVIDSTGESLHVIIIHRYTVYYPSQQMPYPAWTEDGFANAIRNSLPLMLVISFLWIGASISKVHIIFK